MAGGAFAGRRLFSEPAPLGVPLPPVRQLFTILPREQADETSWLERKTADAWLEFLAPQPDGLPPLRWPYMSPLADFTISLPHGAEVSQLNSVDANGVVTEAIGELHYGWPIIRFSFQLVPRRDAETVTEFTARFEHELTASGSELIGQHEPFALPAYQFQHFEYREGAAAENVPESHYIYVGPCGRRVVLMDFVCLDQQHEAARPLLEKILKSFTPGWELKKLMLKEDPGYGELAGTPLGEQEVFLPAAK
jgi:hypothetical protein